VFARLSWSVLLSAFPFDSVVTRYSLVVIILSPLLVFLFVGSEHCTCVVLFIYCNLHLRYFIGQCILYIICCLSIVAVIHHAHSSSILRYCRPIAHRPSAIRKIEFIYITCVVLF